MPTKLVKLELGKPLPPQIEGAEKYDKVWFIIFRDDIPQGCVQVQNSRLPITTEHLRAEIISQLGWNLVGQLDHNDIEKFDIALGFKSPTVPDKFADEPELSNLLPALKPKTGQQFTLSIVVCTFDRPDDLRRCLTTLTQLEAGRHTLELLVVDNHPASGVTEPIVKSFPGVRYEPEPRPGVSYARNKGITASNGDIVAYIDDDVTVSPNWPLRILAPFTDERVMCVSGLVLPVELETYSQEMFEKYGGLGRGYVAKIFDTDFFSSKYAVHTWDLGGTANVAIRKSLIPQTGMFDETLGPGLPTGVGEDIYMFYRILKFGHICYYEPAAYVWHKHRNTMQALKRQLYGYNKGQTSYQLRTLVSDGDKRVIRQLLVDLPFWHVKRAVRILRGRDRYPFSLVWEELKGNIVGPFAFYKANKMHRQLNGPDANPIKSKV